MPSVAFSKAVKRMALPEPFLIRQKARAMDNPDGVSHTKLEAKLTDPERLIIAHALSAAAKPYENDASFDCAARSSLYATQAALIWHTGHRHLA